MGEEPLTDNRYPVVFITWGVYEGVFTELAEKMGLLLTMIGQYVNVK